MGLTLTMYYSPEFVTWGSAVASHEKLSVTIATDPGVAGDVVILGRGPNAIASAGRERVSWSTRQHHILLPNNPELTSRFQAAIHWRRAGLHIEDAGSKPLEVRLWGSRREGPPVENRTREMLRVIGKIPSDGVWFTITPSRDFEDAWSPRVVPRPGVVPARSDYDSPTQPPSFQNPMTRSLFFCPHRPRDSRHLLLAPEACQDSAGHRKRQKYLAVLVAQSLPFLVWPPRGCHIPHEAGQDMPRRYAFTGFKAAPTTPRNDLLREYGELETVVTWERLLDELLDRDLFRYQDIEPLLEHMESCGAVNWLTGPAGIGDLATAGSGTANLQHRIVEYRPRYARA